MIVLSIGFLCWSFAAHFNMQPYGVGLAAAIPIFLFVVTFQRIYASRQVRLKWATSLTRTYGRVPLCTVPSAVGRVILLAFAYTKRLLMICIEGVVCAMVVGACAWCFALSRQWRQDVCSVLRRDRSPADARNAALSQEVTH